MKTVGAMVVVGVTLVLGLAGTAGAQGKKAAPERIQPAHRAETLVGGQVYPRAIAVDGKHVYWVTGGTVWRAHKATGGTPVKLVEGKKIAAIVIDGAELFYADEESGVIGRVPTAGGAAPTVLFTDQHYVSALLVDGTTLTWTVDISADHEHGRIVQGPRQGGTAKVLTKRQMGPKAIVGDGKRLYWATYHGGIASMPRGGGEVTSLATETTITDAKLAHGKVFYADKNHGAVRVVAADGKGQPAALCEDAGIKPTRLAVDGTHVYFIDAKGDRVLRVALAGGKMEILVHGVDARDLVLDADFVYVTVSGDKGGVARINKR
jgi:hypothetical protein